jgi:hypothetical protein
MLAGNDLLANGVRDNRNRQARGQAGTSVSIDHGLCPSRVNRDTERAREQQQQLNKHLDDQGSAKKATAAQRSADHRSTCEEACLSRVAKVPSHRVSPASSSAS